MTVFDTGQHDQTIQDLTFKLTCDVHPEQYDVYDNHNVKVARIRLRHGDLCLSNAEIDEDWWNTNNRDTAFPEHRRLKGDGCFDDDEERKFFLNFMAKIIHKKLRNPNWEAWQENGLYHNPPLTVEDECLQSIVLALPPNFLRVLEVAITEQLAQMQATAGSNDAPNEPSAKADDNDDRTVLSTIQQELNNKSNVVTGKIYQLTQSLDETVNTLQPFGREISDDERLLFAFFAESWEQANTIKNKFFGYEPYKPMD